MWNQPLKSSSPPRRAEADKLSFQPMAAASYASDALESAHLPVDRRRYRKIIWFFSRHFLEFLFWEFGLAAIFGQWIAVRGREKRTQRAAWRFRALALEMGGVMIKLGQFISTRVDLLPRSVIQPLEGLQDEVTPAPFREIQRVLQGALGANLAHFEGLNHQPIAAASLGQVYKARLDGAAVVIKVQRPGIRAMVRTDLEALAVVARWAMRFRFMARRADFPALLEEFSAVLWEELDYRAEANHAERFRHMFADDPWVAVPQVYHTYTTAEMIVLEDVTGIKLNDYAALEAAHIDRTEVARRLLDTYLTQIFVAHFFHADPHPGNIFVHPTAFDPKVHPNGHRPLGAGQPFRIVYVDYGMMGRLTPQLVETLRQTLIAGGLRDARGLVACYERLGLLMPDADHARLEAAMRHTFDLVWGLNMSEMGSLSRAEITRFGHEFRDLLLAMPFRIPQNLIYLGRCAGILSGMCTGLDPNFDPWHEVQPYVRQLIQGVSGSQTKDPDSDPHTAWQTWREFFSPQNVLALLSQENLDLALVTSRAYMLRAVQLPIIADDMLRRAERGDLEVQIKANAELSEKLKSLEAQNRQLIRAVWLGAAMISGAIWWQGRAKSPRKAGD